MKGSLGAVGEAPGYGGSLGSGGGKPGDRASGPWVSGETHGEIRA